MLAQANHGGAGLQLDPPARAGGEAVATADGPVLQRLARDSSNALALPDGLEGHRSAGLGDAAHPTWRIVLGPGVAAASSISKTPSSHSGQGRAVRRTGRRSSMAAAAPLGSGNKAKSRGMAGAGKTGDTSYNARAGAGADPRAQKCFRPVAGRLPGGPDILCGENPAERAGTWL